MIRKQAIRIITFLFCLVATAAIAQTPTGTVQGVVTDTSGAVVAGASITVLQTSTGESRKVTTDQQGRYTVPFLAPGTYTISCDAQGFKTEQKLNVIVSIVQNRPVDFTLQVGAVNQRVQVTANTASLDTSTSSTGEIITSAQILDLPLNGRNPFDLAALVPGVNTTGSGGEPHKTTPHISGSRNANNEEELDGMTNILPENNVGNNLSAYSPVVDSVQEFNIQTSVLPAQYGRFSGGVINLVTKSGTNQLHGSLFEFVRNSALDAKNYFAGSQPKPDLYRYQSGGTIGGPVVLPHVYNGHNRTFFFFAFEKSQFSDAATEIDSVPLPAWRTGDFSALGVPIYDPTTVHLVDPADPSKGYTRDAFPGNIIPVSRMSTVAQAVMKYYPAPNIGAPNQIYNNYLVSGTTTDNYYHWDLKIDHNFRKNWHSFLRLSRYAEDSIPLSDYNNAASQGYGGPEHYHAWSASFDNTVTFTPTLLGEFRYGLTRYTDDRTAFGQGFNPSSLGFPNSFTSIAARDALIFPRFDISNGFSGLGTNGYVPLSERPLAHDVVASLIKIVGGHTITVGGEFRKMLLNFYQFGLPSGEFGVDQSWTQQFLNNSNGSGNPFASLLLGLPSGGYMTHDPKSANASAYWALYAQDDWHATNKLTLNMGLRWDVDIPRTERHNELTYWDPSLPSPIAGDVSSADCLHCGDLKGQMVFVGTSASKYGRHQAPTQWKDFGPRLGFAYSPTDKWDIRGGFGIVFAPSEMQAAGSSGGSGNDGFSSTTGFNFTHDNQQTINTTLDDPGKDGFNLPQGSALGASQNLGSDINYSFFSSVRNPYSEQWNLNIQRQLPGQMVAEVGYVANHGLFLIDGDPGEPFDQVNPSYLSLGQHLYDQVPNPFYGIITTPGSPLSNPTVSRNQLLRPYPQYNGVESERKATAASMYHSVIVRVEKQFSHGLGLSVSYTGAKLMDNSAAAVTYLGPTSGTRANQYDPRLEWSVSPQDISSDLVGTFNYDLPFGRRRAFLNSLPGAVNAIFGGWQANGILSWVSGTPIVLAAVNNETGLFTLNQRPAMTPGDANIPHQSRQKWFNTSLFSQPAPFTIGNAPRTLPNVRTPGLVNADLSAFKNNYFGESQRFNIQLRIEAFNALNHPQFGGPDTGVNDGSNFGTINSTTGNQRNVQIAAKFIF